MNGTHVDCNSPQLDGYYTRGACPSLGQCGSDSSNQSVTNYALLLGTWPSGTQLSFRCARLAMFTPNSFGNLFCCPERKVHCHCLEQLQMVYIGHHVDLLYDVGSCATWLRVSWHGRQWEGKVQWQTSHYQG